MINNESKEGIKDGGLQKQTCNLAPSAFVAGVNIGGKGEVNGIAVLSFFSSGISVILILCAILPIVLRYHLALRYTVFILLVDSIR